MTDPTNPSRTGTTGTVGTTERAQPPWSGQRWWHIADWGPWGWAETAIKLVAIAVAVIAAAGGAALAIPDHHRLTYWILFAVAVGYLFTVLDRLQDREIVAMAFVAAMIVGHWAMVLVMGRDDWPAGIVRAFAGLMLVGDLVKIGYFTVTGARVREFPRAVPIVMTAALAGCYLVALLAS